MSNLQQVVDALQFSMNGTGEQRKYSREIMDQGFASVDQSPGFTRCLLDICTNEQGAAIQFKNLVKKCWNPETSDHIIVDEAKNAIKDALFDLVINSHKLLFNHLETALGDICEVDFPHNWPSLLNHATQRLKSLFSDARTIPRENMMNARRCMSALHAIVSKYRKPSELLESMAKEYAHLHTTLIGPLLACLSAGSTGINNAIQAQDLDSARASCAFVCKSLDALNDVIWLDLSNEYENDIGNFFKAYSSFLQLRCPPIERSNDSDSLAEVKLRTLAILTLHVQKYAEESRQFIPTLANDAWNVLRPSNNNNSNNSGKGSDEPAEDALVISVIQFLEHIAHTPFLRGILEPMVEPIINTCIMPNVELDDYDVDVFEEDPQDYIEHDVEGADSWTRRRAATELIRALIDGFHDRVGPIFTNALGQMIDGYQSNNQRNWKNKDSAMFLVTALAARGNASSQRGTVGRLTDLVNVPEFYGKHVMPELQVASGQTPSSQLPTPVAVLKASAIKFVSTFRQHIPLSEFPTLFGLFAGWVDNNNVVLFSYAAHAIERLLSDNRVNPDMIDRDLAGRLLQPLCIRLSKTSIPNEFLTRAIAGVAKVCTSAALDPYVGDVVMCLHSYLAEYFKAPSNAQFTHYLFESIAWLIRHCPQYAPQIKDVLWQTMMTILQQNVLEMMPYVLQIVAQLLDTVQPGTDLPNDYTQLLQPLLSPVFLQEKGNIPAIVRLVGSFLRQGGNAISQQQQAVSRMFEVCCNLILSKQTDTDGFNMLVGLTLHLTQQACDQFIIKVWHAIMQRLQGSRTPKFEKACVIGCAAIVSKYGGEGMAQMMEGIQNGLYIMFCNRFIALSAASATSRFGKKCALILLRETMNCLVNTGRLQQDGPKLFTDLLQTGMKIVASGSASGAVIVNRQFGGDNNSDGNKTQLRSNNNSRNQSSNNLDGFNNNNNNGGGGASELLSAAEIRTNALTETGFTNSFCPLQGAQRDPDDPFPQIENPMRVFVDDVRGHMNSNQQLANAVQSALPPPMLQMLRNS